jgi:hypothetical protein
VSVALQLHVRGWASRVLESEAFLAVEGPLAGAFSGSDLQVDTNPRLGLLPILTALFTAALHKVRQGGGLGAWDSRHHA